MATKGKKGQKVRGVYWRADRGEWWVRWTCVLGKKHRQASGPDKELARRERSDRVLAVRTARKVGELSCSKCIPTVTDKPVLFEELLDDLLRRRDLKARDET